MRSIWHHLIFGYKWRHSSGIYCNISINTGPDFAVAAEAAQKVVVLIEAAESAETAQLRRRRQDPMQQLFEQFGLDSDDRLWIWLWWTDDP